MKSAVTILVGLLAGVAVAAAVLAAFVFVGPDPVGLRPTPAPTLIASPPLAGPSGAGASPAISGPPGGGSGVPSGSGPAPGSPAPSTGDQAAFRVGQPAPALVVRQVGGGQIDLSNLRGKAVWLNFMQTTCPECIDEFPG